MLEHVFYVLSAVLVLSGLPALKMPSRERVFSISLLRCLVALPLLTVHYLYAAYDLNPEASQAVLLFEAELAVAWAFMAYRLGRAMVSAEREPLTLTLTELLAGMSLWGCAWFLAAALPPGDPFPHYLVIHHNGFAYLSAFLILCSMLAMAWRLEGFWRNLEPLKRWEYKFLVVGSLLVCCSLAWAGSYRLTYLRLQRDHFLLLGCLLLIGWLMMFYAVTRHRLLNRKLFISRKVVQATVAPALFGGYLLGVGVITLLGRLLGWTIPFVVLGLLGAAGFVAVGLYWCSGRLRRRVQHFISTHFYVNKYEYRDEWLALSAALRGAVTGGDIVGAVSRLLAGCVYAERVGIWIADPGTDGRLLLVNEEGTSPGSGMELMEGDPLLSYFREHGVFYLDGVEGGELWAEAAARWGDFLRRERLVLLSPIISGDEVLGVIGLGEEFTGGRYGLDDFDLLGAISAQTASALVAARRADELIALREREAVNAFSTFVLHDIKNAATMLSLVRANAAEHIHDPEFQADMLEAVDNALKRMAKVQGHLSTLKGEIRAKKEEVELQGFLNELVEGVLKKSTGLEVSLECSGSVTGRVDRGLLATVLENLLINALQSGGEGTRVRVEASKGPDGTLVLGVLDDGPGIPEEMLPDRLFQAFETGRKSGSGIGLWQAKAFVNAMGGSIRAENTPSGARFVISIPGS
mgnify:CR=1 FL=1